MDAFIKQILHSLHNPENEALWLQRERMDELYALRRQDRFEQKFWNQFWHRWDYGRLKEAATQAFRDMLADNDMRCRTVQAPSNFEKVVAVDQYRYREALIYLLYDL